MTQTPMTDPRPFAEVLRDWMARGAMTYEGAAAALGDDGRPVARRTVAQWLAGDQPRYERQARALMTLIDQGAIDKNTCRF
ncbi:MAG TPA: hypothetical protein DC061_02510 [Gemmobacter sp.]|nr:hypothetical protein [Gemmobacter sp.]